MHFEPRHLVILGSDAFMVFLLLLSNLEPRDKVLKVYDNRKTWEGCKTG